MSASSVTVAKYLVASNGAVTLYVDGSSRIHGDPINEIFFIVTCCGGNATKLKSTSNVAENICLSSIVRATTGRSKTYDTEG